MNMDQSLFTNEKETVVRSERTLYTASSFAKASLMYLQEIGTLTAKKQHTSRRADLDSYLFLTVCDGSGTITVDGAEYDVKAGDAVFIDCRRPYSHTTSKDDLWTLKWIHMNGMSMPAIYEKYRARGGRPVLHDVTSGQYEQMMAIHDRLSETVSGDDHVRDMKINEYLCELLTVLMELAWDPAEKKTAGMKKDVLPVKMYLDEHFTEKISLDELSERFYINKYYLTRVFKEQYGVSVNTYIGQRRITKAKQLIRFTDYSLEDIGLQCGIGELNYFSRMFRKVEGMSPRQYRRGWRENK